MKPSAPTEISNLVLYDAAFVLDTKACIHPEDSTLYAMLLNLVCTCSCIFIVSDIILLD